MKHADTQIETIQDGIADKQRTKTVNQPNCKSAIGIMRALIDKYV